MSVAESQQNYSFITPYENNNIELFRLMVEFPDG